MLQESSTRLASACTALYSLLVNIPGTRVRESVAEIRLPEDSSFIFRDSSGTIRPLVGIHFSMDHREAFPIVKKGEFEHELFYGEYTEDEIIRSCTEISEHYQIIHFRDK